MGNREYHHGLTVDDVPWRLRDHVQLRAVLLPLTGRPLLRGAVPDRAYWIKARWRRLLKRLRDARYPQLCGPAGRYDAGWGCPVAFVVAGQKTRPCCMRTVCPFCWARDVAATWEPVDGAFFDDFRRPPVGRFGRRGRGICLGGPPAPGAAPFCCRAEGRQLVVRSYRFTFPLDRPGPHDRLRDFLSVRRTGRGLSGRAVPWMHRSPEIREGLAAADGPAGCFENILVGLSSARDRWTARACQVWMLPEGTVLPPPAPGLAKVAKVRERSLAEPWRYQVAWAVAGACRYPRFLLAKDGEAHAMRYLTARRGMRLAESYGMFRKTRKGREP